MIRAVGRRLCITAVLTYLLLSTAAAFVPVPTAIIIPTPRIGRSSSSSSSYIISSSRYQHTASTTSLASTFHRHSTPDPPPPPPPPEEDNESSLSVSQEGESAALGAAANTPTPARWKEGSNSNNKKGSNTGGNNNGNGGLGEYKRGDKLPGRKKQVNVGDPQLKVKDGEMKVATILQELAAIQQQGPKKYCVLGTRHCSFLHQQIIELLAYALVLSGNHVYTSGAGGTHAATIRGALRAERPDLLTVVLPQSFDKQPKESQDLLRDVTDVITMPQNDDMSLDVASRICNSYLLSQTDQLISFAFHESTTVIEATKEAKKLDMLVTVLFLD